MFRKLIILAAIVTLTGCCEKMSSTSVPEAASNDEASPAESPATGDLAASSFLVLGDWGTGDDNQREVADAMVDYCQSETCEFVLTVGDNFYEEGVESVTDKQWQEKYRDVYDELGLPFYASLGNHDVDDDANEQAQIDYSEIDSSWHMPAEDYSFVWPEVPSNPVIEFFIFNSQYPHFRDEVVQEWMDSAIEASHAIWKVMVMHHPIYSDGKHGDDNQGNNEYLFPIICNRIHLILSGHDHNFGHLRKKDADCPIEQLVVGTGGASIRTNVTDTEAEVVKRGDFHGFGWIKATADKITFRMIKAEDGSVFYTTEWLKP